MNEPMPSNREANQPAWSNRLLHSALGMPLLVCLLLAFWMTGPVWVADEPSLVGHWGALDLPGSVWAHWWVIDSLHQGANPFVDTVSFHPFGLDPVLQYNLLDAVVGAPWVLLAGLRVGYNLATIAALTTTGIGGYLLAKHCGLRLMGALFAAVTIQSSSAVALELYEGRISQVMLVFFLLSLTSLVRLIRSKSTVRTAIGLGCTAAATALIYWYSGLFLLLTAAIILLFCSKQLDKQRLSMLTISTVVGLGLTLPFVLELVQQWDTLPGMTRGAADANGSANFVSLKTGQEIATDNSRWPLWPIMSRADQEAGHQIGLVTLLLTVMAFRWKLPNKAQWMGVAGFGWIMALGPKLHGYDETMDISMPFGWMQEFVPTFNRMWWPQRFEVLTAIGLAIVAGMALDHWLKNRSHASKWFAVILCLSVFDAPIRSGVLPVRASVVPESNPSLYEGLSGAILTTPARPNVGILNNLRWMQTIHGLPIQNGNGEHIPGHRPPGYTEWIDSNPIFEAMTRLHRQRKVTATIQPEHVQALIDAGFEYAVADPGVYGHKSGRNWTVTHGRFFEPLWGKPIKVSKGGAVWRITPIDQSVQIDAEYAQGKARQLR